MAKGDYGFNGKISAPGFGGRKVRCMGLKFGLGIISTSGAEARSRRAYYSIVTTGSSFTISLGFVSYEERERFNQWITRFMKQVSTGEASKGFMTIQVPNRDFYRTAVPDGEIAYGEGVTDVGYVLDLSYVGASDPLNLDLGQRQAGISYFKGPKNNAESRYFYPAGRQVRGAEALDGTVYDPLAASGGTFTPSVDDNRTPLLSDTPNFADDSGV